MDVVDCEIPEVKIFTPQVFQDSRGYFTETYTKNKFEKFVTGLTFVQDNESFSTKKFTVRGLHYQAPPFAQDKLVRVLKGRIFDVAVDIRERSPTFGRWVGAELSADNRKQLLAPAGFLHGFMTLEPDTLVAYKVTNFYDKAADGAVHWASPDFNIDWPAAPEAVVLSEKDAAAPDFGAFKTPF
ncbi:MAG: dTDP-4-dehydrorhamnose 3,5-epimerase [Pseudomonadota bacterium]